MALEILAARSVDAIVTDERMPLMSGGALLRLVRARHPDTVRIMVTGEADIRTTSRAIQDGEVYRFLCKPVSSALMASTLRRRST